LDICLLLFCFVVFCSFSVFLFCLFVYSFAAQAGLELMIPPGSPSPVLGLQASALSPASKGGPYFMAYTKINSEWIHALNLRIKL
jgi:hypothetical protein